MGLEYLLKSHLNLYRVVRLSMMPEPAGNPPRWIPSKNTKLVVFPVIHKIKINKNLTSLKNSTYSFLLQFVSFHSGETFFAREIF